LTSTELAGAALGATYATEKPLVNLANEPYLSM
jgi:hypothetical protein